VKVEMSSSGVIGTSYYKVQCLEVYFFHPTLTFLLICWPSLQLQKLPSELRLYESNM